MKHVFILIFISLSFALLFASGSLFSAINEPGDDLQTLPLPSNSSLKSAQPAVPKPNYSHPKLTSTLSRFLDTFNSKGATAADEYARIHDITFSDGRVLVELMLRRDYVSDDVSPDVLERFGVEIDSRSKHFIIVRIPVDQLAAFSENIDNVSLIHRPFRAIADVTSEGVELIGANAFHEENITGQDVSVAIVDIGFNRFGDGQDAGELPENPTVRNYTGVDMDEGSVHGSACTEIIYDLVPDANFYLMKVANDADLENAIDFLIGEEVDVISMSLSWIVAVEDYFQGGDHISRKVNEAFDQGILYVNSAGNYANSHYRAEFDDRNEEGDFHCFDNGVTVNHFGTAVDRMYNIDEGTSLWTSMAWDDFPESGQDFDLYMVWWNEEQDRWDIVAESRNQQNGNDPPYEYVSYRAERDGSYGVMVHSETGDNGMDFTLVTAYDIAWRTHAGSVLIPAIAEDNFAVGAVYWQEWNEEEPSLEPFSSQGPTYDGRTKPEISAPDGTTSFIYEREFFGTSASCPHVAGAAALVLSAYPNWDNVELRDYLQENAVDVGEDGQDNLFGYGLLNIELNRPPVIIVDAQLIEIELFTGDIEARSISISNVGESDLRFHIEIEYIDEPPRDRIEQRSLRSVSSTGAPRRDDLGDEIARFSFNPEPDNHFSASSAWDEDNEVMWLPRCHPDCISAITFDHDYDNFQEEVAFHINEAMTGLASMHNVLYVATWDNQDLLRYDIEGNNLGGLEMPRQPTIIAASEEMERLIVIDNPDGENMYFYEVADDEVRQTGVLNWRVEQLGEGDCRGICWVDRHPDGQLWIMVDDGLYEFAVDEDNLEIIELIQDLEYQDNQWFSVSHDGRNLWLGTENHPEWSIIDDGIREFFWLMIDPGEGILEPNQEIDIEIIFCAIGCLHGIYEAAIHFLSNDPENPDVVVRVEMYVEGCPVIDVRWSEEAGYPDLIDWNGVFDDLFTGAPYELVIEVENVGTADLEIEEISVEGDDFQVNPNSLSLEPREESEVTLSFEVAADEPGEYEAFLIFISNDPVNNELRIPMRAVAYLPPVIIVEPLEIEFPPNGEDIYATNINISNEGESDLRFRIEIEVISEPGRDRIEQRSLRSVSSTGTPRRDDPGDEIARLSFDREPDDHFIASSAWDEDNEVMWLPSCNPNRLIVIAHHNYEDFEEVRRFGVNGTVTGLAWLHGVLYVAIWGSDDLLRFDEEGNNLGNMEMPRRPVIITASQEEGRLMVIDDPDGDNMYFYNIDRNGEAHQTSVLQWRVEQLGEGDCRSICWVDRHRDGQLWIMVDDGLYEFEVDMRHPEIVEIRQDLEYRDNQWFSVSHDGYNLWLGTENHPEWSIIDDGIREFFWLTIDPREGILEPDEECDITFTLNATGRIEGIYEAAIHFLSNDPENPDVVVSVIMDVVGCPAIDVHWPEEAGYPDLIDWNGWFDDLFPPDEYPLPIVVENVGNRDLEIETYVEGDGFDLLGEGRFVLPPGAEREVVLIFLGEEPGIYEGFLYFISNDENNELRIPMRAVVEGNRPPEIAREIPDQQLREDFEPFVVADLDIVFDDPEGDELYFWAGSDDENLQTEIDEDNRLRLSVTENWVGQAHVTVIADDDPIEDERDAGPVRTLRSISGGSKPVRDEPVEFTFSVEIENVNDAPQFTEYPDEILTSEGEHVQFTIVIEDADFDQVGDSLSFRLFDDDGLGERGAEFVYEHPDLIIFTWQTGFDDAGLYRPVFAVEDEAGARDVGSFSLIVHDVNQSPEWAGPGFALEFTEDDDGRITVNLSYRFIDPDGDEMQFSAEGDGLRAMVSPDGWLWVEPVPDWSGWTQLDLWANDGRGGITHHDEHVFVAPVNDLPTPFSLLTPEEGDTVRSYPTVLFSWEPSTDVEDSTIIYTLMLDFTNGGRITWGVWDETEIEVPRHILGLEPDQPRGIDWHVWAYDGIDSICSTEKFSIVIAPLSVGDGDALLPVELALGPVYPNPFNDVITISYAVPRQTEMSLSILDPLGRRIRTLEHGGISAGSYVTHWDGCNQNGMKVSSGMYICLLTTPDKVLLQRIVLLR